MDKYNAFIGKVLDGRYKILGLVGIGGMAFVLKAEDLAMNRIVAIKVLNDQYNGDATAEKRFINESKAVAMLSSKYIVGIYDVVIYPDLKYIVMEFLDGITLKEYLNKKGKLPWKEACNYALQILRALEHVHSKGIIHRDIKPQNIMLLHTGEIKVTDFGIAITPNLPAPEISDNRMGTVYYMSPEQAGGKETNQIADIYSVGIMLYEMVTGELPFVAEGLLDVAMMQINDTPKDPHELCADVPIGISQIILKAIAKAPEDRFEDAHSMLKAVDYAIKNPGVVFADENLTKARTSKNSIIDVEFSDTSELEGVVSDPLSSGKAKKKKPKKKNKKKFGEKLKEHRGSSLFPIITGVFFAFFIVVVIAAGYVAIKWVPRIFESEEIPAFEVRDLVEMQYSEELKKELESQNYKVTVIRDYFPGEEYNKIMKQDPESGLKRLNADYCSITLTVNDSRDDLTVPDVKYLKASEAEKILRQYSLQCTIEYRSDPFASIGQVVGTNPEIGTQVDIGRNIIIYVSNGNTPTSAKPVPDVVGLQVDQAIKLLEDAYYDYEIERVDSDKPKNEVIWQSLDPHTKGHEAWTKIKLQISSPTNLTFVPSMIGNTLEAAERQLINAGLSLGSVTYDPTSDRPAGTVIYQSVEADTEVTFGTVVNITVSGEKTVYAAPVPDVIGYEAELARQLLADAKYNVIFEYVSDSNGTPGTVKEISLEVGGDKYPENTDITVYVIEIRYAEAVPDVIGKEITEAESMLLSAGYTVVKEFIESDAAENTVVRISLEVGSTGHLEYAAVTVYVAKKPQVEMVEVPDVTGMSVDDANQLLISKGLKLGSVTYENDPNSAAGFVIAQDPGECTSLPKGSEVNVTVCGSGDVG